MEDYRSAYQSCGSHWKLETNGNGYNSDQVYRSSDHPTNSSRISSSAGNSTYSYSSSSSWIVKDPEMKRRKRVAMYKAYGVEGRMKASIRKGFRWVKNKYSELVHGY